MTVRVVTDSICAPSAGLAAELGVAIVPINIHLRGKVYRDLVDITPEEIYRLLPALKELPTTAAPPESRFEEVFQKILGAGDSLVCFTVTSQLSATYGSARQALNNLPGDWADRARIIDTGTAGAAGSVLVAEAARLSGQGLSLEEIAARIEAMLEHCKLLVAVDTLRYLEKGGKVKKLAALAGDIFTIKPIFFLSGGEAVPTGRPRGMRQAKKMIMDTFYAETAGAERVWAAATHADALEEGRQIVEEIKARFPGMAVDLVPFTVAMGIHGGPGVLGLGYTWL